jgi:hypothetical protein
MLNNPNTAKKMGTYGHKKVTEQFAWDNKIFLTHNLIKRVLEKHV